MPGLGSISPGHVDTKPGSHFTGVYYVQWVGFTTIAQTLKIQGRLILSIHALLERNIALEWHLNGL